MRIALLILSLLACFFTEASAQAPSSTAAPLDCSRGPVVKTFGGAPWNTYACSDGRSVVLMSAPGSAAAPFYFMFAANGSAYRLVGEGNGDKGITDKAHGELKALSPVQVRQLFNEAAAVRSPK